MLMVCNLLLVTKLIEVKELFKNRVDRLLERHYDYQTEWVTEKFGPGRLKNIQGHLNVLLFSGFSL